MSAAASGNRLYPYPELLALAERQHELACRGEIAALEPLWRSWERLAAKAPARPPAAAVPLLRRARALQELTAAKLAERQETLMREAAMTARAGRATRGYVPARQRQARLDCSV